MFTYLTNGKRSKAAQMAMAAMALSMLTSCHFGDIDDVRPKDYADVTRTFEISLDAITPSGTGTTRTVMIDQFTDGLEVLWKEGDKIALFSEAIDAAQDDHPIIMEGGGVSDPEANPSGTISDYLNGTSFKGKGKLKTANNTTTVNGQEMWDETKAQADYYLVYPGGKFKDLSANAGAVTLNFKDQDGNLQTLAQNYEYAWARAKGIAQGHVSFGTLKLIDNTKDYCNIPNAATYADAHKQHNQAQNGGVVMDNKMSVIRFCLVHKDEQTGNVTSFKDFLTSKNGGYQVTKIILSEETASGGVLYNEATLDLTNGTVAGTSSGNIVIENPNGIKLEEIPNEGSAIGSTESWGSAFYVAIPVPDAAKIYDCHLEIYVTSSGITEDEVAGIYYANFKNRTFKEGNYYMTAPIDCSKREQASIENEIRIYLYHNSSLVYDVEDIKSETVLAKANGTNNAVGEKDMFEKGNAQVGDILRIYFTRDNGYSFESYNVQIYNRFWDKLIFSELNNTNTINKDTEAGRQAANRGYFEFELTQERLDLLKKIDPSNDPNIGMYIQHSGCHDVRVSLIKLN